MLTNKQIDEKVNELKELEDQIKQLKKLADSIKLNLKDELDTRNVECVDTGFNKVWYKLKNTCTFDSKSFKESYKDLYEQYCKRDCTTMFMITSSVNE